MVDSDDGGFFLHYSPCSMQWMCVCVSETGPGPSPAHYSLAVLRVYARVGSVFRPYWLFLCRRDPHYCPHTVTSICFPPSLFFSSCHALQSALSMLYIRLTWSEGGEKDWEAHEETRYWIRDEHRFGRVRTYKQVQADGFTGLSAEKQTSDLIVSHHWAKIDLWPWFNPCPRRPSPQAPLRERQLLQWCIARHSVQHLGNEGGQGLKRERESVWGRGRRDRERKGIMSVSKLAWLTQRKTAVCVTNDLFQ